MADVELVIKIPEEEYNFMKTQVAFGNTNPLKMRIAYGTPLPKHHGRLVDADAFIERTERIYKLTGYVLMADDVEHEPTIIEADKGESSGEE